MSLVSFGVTISSLLNHSLEDTLPIIAELPKKVKCFIIHNKYLKNSYYGSLYWASNICIEVRLIRETYEIKNEDNKVLFNPAQLTKYVLTLNNLVVSLIWALSWNILYIYMFIHLNTKKWIHGFIDYVYINTYTYIYYDLNNTDRNEQSQVWLNK